MSATFIGIIKPDPTTATESLQSGLQGALLLTGQPTYLTVSQCFSSHQSHLLQAGAQAVSG